jgi:2-polyprenyl-3-methyl-5-hydroxy-6-metoxy-1,4-benzoquinol methylase
MPVNKFGFPRWNFQYEINGDTTLDPEADHKILRRIAGRKKLFMDPLCASGFLRGKRVLDLGSNAGYWSYVALAEGGAAQVTGIEASPDIIKQAEFVFRAKGVDPDSYAFHCRGAYGFLEACDEPFDVILCLGFFYHIHEPLLLLMLMQKAARDFVVIDTIVHKSDEALISVRPVAKGKVTVEEAAMSLELVSSRKAIFWMAEEAGYKQARLLTDTYEKISSMWDYIGAFRECFVLSNGPPVEPVWPNAIDPGFLSGAEDFKKYGYFPEMHRKGGRSET